MFEVIYRFTGTRDNIKDLQCGVFDTIEAAKEYILEQFDDLIASTTDDETGQVMVEEDGWYEKFILDKYKIRQVEVTLN
jgi:hypothetical protein